MIIKKTVQFLAAALLVCSVLMLPLTPASAAQDVSLVQAASLFYEDEPAPSETPVDPELIPPATEEETTVAPDPGPVAPPPDPVVETVVTTDPEPVATPPDPVIEDPVVTDSDPAPVESSLPPTLIAEAIPPTEPPPDDSLPPPPLPPESPLTAPAGSEPPAGTSGAAFPPGPFPPPPGPVPPPAPPAPPPGPPPYPPPPFPPGPIHPNPPYPNPPYPIVPYYPRYAYNYPWYYSSWISTTYPYVVVPSTPTPVYTPVISSFTANPSYIQPGQSSTLSWTVNNTADISISPSVGSVPTTGVYVVTPAYTTTYTLSASNSAGTVVASTTVTVAPYIGSTYYTGSTYTGTVETAPVTSQAPTSNSGATLAWWLPYILLIALLAAAAMIIVILLLRKPVAQGAHYGAARGGAMPAVTSPVATLPATGSPKTTPVAVAPAAKFVASNGSELSLAGDGNPLGRRDFQSMVSPDKADLISRQHITVSYENGQCYIEDHGSTNGTRLNGSAIKGAGRHALKDGDTIDLAGALSIIFRS